MDITHVPFNGGAPATMSAIGGHTTLLVSNVLEIAPNARAGKLRALDLPEVRDARLHHGLTPAPMTPDQFTAFIRSEMERSAKIIKTLNVKIE